MLPYYQEGHIKSLVRGWGAKVIQIQNFRFYRTCPVNSPDSRTGLSASRDGYQTSSIPPPDLSGPWLASREASLASKDLHRTCPMARTCPV
jgi:hypothetical protein